MIILAIDLGKFNSVSCRFDDETQETSYERFQTSRKMLARILEEQQPHLVAIEACAIAGWVVDLCRAMRIEVVVANVAEDAWKWKKLKRKTDRDDALKLAKPAALGQITAVYTPGPAVRQWRTLIKHRKALVGQRNRVQNAIRALLAAQGLAMPRAASAWTQAGLEELRQQARPLEECSPRELWRGELTLHLQMYDFVCGQIKELEKKLDAVGQQEENVRLLQTIPGVGPRTAETVAAWIDDPRRFKSGRQVSAYAGLVPRKFQSGEMDRNGRITKRGPRALRSALVEAAWLALRYNPWALEVYTRIGKGQKTRKKQALVAVARKLLVTCWAILRTRKGWDPARAAPGKPQAA
jgi:transposase